MPETKVPGACRAGFLAKTLGEAEWPTALLAASDRSTIGSSGHLVDLRPFSGGVNDTEAYPALLDQSLETDVINAGFAAGWSPDMYYAWLVERRNSLQASAYLIGFFLGNDIDGHPSIVWDAIDKRGLPTKLTDTESHLVGAHWMPRSAPLGYRYPVLRESHLFHLAGTAFRRIETLWRVPARPPSVFDSDIHPVADAIETTKRVFAGIKAECDSRATPVGVIMIPTLQQVRGESNDVPNRIFADYLRSIGMPFIDLLPSMKGRVELYYPVDQHWNALGHRHAAQEVARWLKGERSLRPRSVEPR